MTLSFDDPHFQPPVDIDGADARAYEEKIVELLREALMPGPGPHEVVHSIELRGQRPETRIVFSQSRSGDPDVRRRSFALWASDYPTSGAVDGLHGPGSVAGWIFSDWMADDLDSEDPSTAGP